MLKESKADIFVDPVLHTACALDLKHHCAAINPGRGRREYFLTFVSHVHFFLKAFTMEMAKFSVVARYTTFEKVATLILCVCVCVTVNYCYTHTHTQYSEY